MKKTIELPEQKSKKKCIWLTAAKIFAVYLLIWTIITIIFKIKKRKMKKREAENDDREIKEYYAYMEGKEILINEKEFKGMLIKSRLSGIDIDLTEAKIMEDSFITVKSLMSGISIKVPEGVNVKLDGRFRLSASSNKVPEYLDDEVPTLYVAVNSVMSGIAVKVSEKKEEDCESIFAE